MSAARRMGGHRARCDAARSRGVCVLERARMDVRPFLLLKASARQMPLPDHSVSLVIATPPCFGVRHLRRVDYCTNQADEYARLITEFLEEAARIVKPRRHI